jgi:O-acetyl-ADP-ribose deacetylase (regulator of RNase III)
MIKLQKAFIHPLRWTMKAALSTIACPCITRGIIKGEKKKKKKKKKKKNITNYWSLSWFVVMILCSQADSTAMLS